MSLENYTHAILEEDLAEVALLASQPGANTQQEVLHYCEHEYQSPDSRLIANALSEILKFQWNNRDSLIELGFIRRNDLGSFSVNPEMTGALHFYFFHVHSGEMVEAPAMRVFQGHVNILRSRPTGDQC